MIDVSHLTKYYGRVLAVDNISFHVARGAVVGFLGPNGAGKSTTLKILTCSFPATAGKASVAGFDVFTQSMQVRQQIGYMPENVPLYGDMRVREFLKFRAALRGLHGQALRSAVDRVCKTCWLSEPEDMTRRPINQLSRGYRQRVGLAEVLLHSPPVLVLDEPTLGLDPNQIRQMRTLIKDLGADHTVILSSHILAEVEQTCSDIIIIAGGKIAASGKVEELRRRVSGPNVILAELRGAEPAVLAAAAGALPGARKVQHDQAGNWTRLTIEAAEDRDLRADLAKLAADKGWALRELRRKAGSLEDFFVQITYRQQMLAPTSTGAAREAVLAATGSE